MVLTGVYRVTSGEFQVALMFQVVARMSLCFTACHRVVARVLNDGCDVTVSGCYGIPGSSQFVVLVGGFQDTELSLGLLVCYVNWLLLYSREVPGCQWAEPWHRLSSVNLNWLPATINLILPGNTSTPFPYGIYIFAKLHGCTSESAAHENGAIFWEEYKNKQA